MTWVDELVRVCGDHISCQLDVSSATLCTWRVGGPLRALVVPRNLDDLVTIAQIGLLTVPILVVGRGSNLLIADAGFDGLAIQLAGDFETISISTVDAIRAGGAASLPVLARRCAAVGQSGLEFYVGIPGSVGGAVRMNAGGHGRCTADVLQHANVFDIDRAQVVPLSPADLHFGYRYSKVSARDVVIDAVFATGPDDPTRCGERVDAIVAWRRAHQPGGANAGSVFANPDGDSAGRLIEAAGAKGRSIGGAFVSDKHANFIQARTGATAGDVTELIEVVQRMVFERLGVWLNPEVHRIGFDNPRSNRSEMRS